MKNTFPLALALCAALFLSACAGTKNTYQLLDSVPTATLTTHHAYDLTPFTGRTDTVMAVSKLPNNCGRLRNLHPYEKGKQVVETKVEAEKDLFIRVIRRAGSNHCMLNFILKPQTGKSYEVEFVEGGRKLWFANMHSQCGVKVSQHVQGDKKLVKTLRRPYSLSGHGSRVCVTESDAEVAIETISFKDDW